MFIRLDRVPACDGRTDGQTDGIAVGIQRSALHAIRPRCNKTQNGVLKRIQTLTFFICVMRYLDSDVLRFVLLYHECGVCVRLSFIYKLFVSVFVCHIF